MAKKAGKSISNVFVWILMALLFAGLAFTGVSNFGGGAGRVGSVGDVEITADDYFLALQNELNAQIQQSGTLVTFNDLRSRGVDEQVLAGLVARAALTNEALQIGISAGDEEVVSQIAQIQAFQGIDGNFDVDTYEFVLQQNGATPREFEEETREDISRALLQTAIISAINTPDLFVDAIVAYQGETRDFSLVAISEDDLPEDLPEPTEADLTAYYEEFPVRFTRPEARRITYAWITPTDIMDQMEVPEEALRELYEERLSIYSQPERRLLERLVFGSDEDAQAAFDAIAEGDTDFDTLLDERELTIDDVDLGEVAFEDLPAAAAEVIFADDESEIIGPLTSNLGPALFRVNAVLEASEVPFEDARDDLAAELSEEAARRDIIAMMEEIDDLLASGATLEEVAETTALTLGTLDYTAASEEGIAAYDNFRDAADAVTDRDFPELLELSDGGLFALRLDEIVPPTLPPLDEITEEVADAWARTALRDAVAARAQELVGQMAQGATLEDLGEPAQERLMRRQDIVPDLPPTTVPQVFQLEAEGDVVMIPGAEAAYVVRLDTINSAARDTPDTQVLLQILDQTIANALAGDVFEAYGQAVQARSGISTNAGVINAVHAAFQ